MLEHYISEELEALIAAKLGEPSHDPHGTPIPGPTCFRPRARERRVKPPPTAASRRDGRGRPSGRGRRR